MQASQLPGCRGCSCHCIPRSPASSALHPAAFIACRAFAEQRAAALGQTLEGVLSTEPEGLGSDPEARRCVLAGLLPCLPALLPSWPS
jgi:hypothetical protein